MTFDEWTEAMRLATQLHDACIRECARLWQQVAKEARNFHFADWQALNLADAKRCEAYLELQRVKALRPPYVPDWVDGMGHTPPYMPPIVEEDGMVPTTLILLTRPTGEDA